MVLEAGSRLPAPCEQIVPMGLLNSQDIHIIAGRASQGQALRFRLSVVSLRQGCAFWLAVAWVRDRDPPDAFGKEQTQ